MNERPWEMVRGLPDQCRDAWSFVGADLQVRRPSRPAGLCFLGVGGSAAGSDLLKAFLADRVAFPILVNRDYDLPACVNRHWLVIAVSYSGNTEETLSAYAQARRRGCRLVAITSGGALAARAAKDRVPMLRIPEGYAPRATVGYLFFTPLAYLRRLGLVRVSDTEIAEAVARVGVGPRDPRVIAPARLVRVRNLARTLAGHIPMIYAPERLLPVAVRWKNQMEENAKVWCSALAIPEANHNDIESWGRGAAWAKAQVVILRDPRGETPVLRRRLNVSTRMLHEASGGRLVTVRAEGHSALARLWSLVALGDAVSVALADHLRVDSTPIPMIDRLKRALKRGQSLILKA